MTALNNLMLDAALDYAGRGWPVHPLRPRQKVPASPNGCKDATLDPERIKGWWARQPDANLGLATGHLFDVIDIDNWDAADRVQELAGPDWPTGPTSLTPHGWHVLVQPTGRGNTAAIIPGLDHRGRGGYVVAPPSVVNNVVYIWSPAFPPALDLPPCPKWLLDLWDDRHQRPAIASQLAIGHRGFPTSGGYGRRALESELGRLVLVAEGARNDELVKAAYRLGQLVAAGDLAAAEVAGALLVAAARIGLSDTEATATIASGMRSGMLAPRPDRSSR